MADANPKRCRLVLIVPPEGLGAAALEAALSGGDVASVIIPAYDMVETAFQEHAESLVPLAQQANAAVMIAGDTRIADRVKADGVHLEGNRQAMAEELSRLQSRLLVGAGGIKTRDDALEIGELRPDYVFFGRFGYDNTPEPHPRNLGLASWWAEVIAIPCVVLGGATIASVEAVAATGAEFVALSRAIFAAGEDPRQRVAEVNALLDQKAPRFAD